MKRDTASDKDRPLAVEVNWFEEHRTRLLSAHPGKWAVVHNHRLVGIYDTPEEAYNQGLEKTRCENILIKKIVAVDEVLSAPAMVLGLLNAPHNC